MPSNTPNRPPSPAGAKAVRAIGDQEVLDWAWRHDIQGNLTELRAAFDDAATLHMTEPRSRPARGRGRA